MDQQELSKKLETIMAGETIVWNRFEKFLDLARPKTLSTIMNISKIEGSMEATQDKIFTPFQLDMIKVFTAGLIIFILIAIAKSMGFIDI
jgi:hypothetical protein